MAKLSKTQIAAHKKAVAILEKDVLTMDDKWFVLENWNEGAEHMNGLAGAFFTPTGLARDFVIDTPGGKRVVDLCAGIGCLSFMLYHYGSYYENTPDITCVELNPAYAAVGKRILPEATWIVADVLSLPEDMKFDVVISNPPFGNIKTGAPHKGKYTGSDFDFKVIEVGMKMAPHGTFIVPSNTAPFKYSGERNFSWLPPNCKARKFMEQTGIFMGPGCGIDTEIYREEWRNTSPRTEVVCTSWENDYE